MGTRSSRSWDHSSTQTAAKNLSDYEVVDRDALYQEQLNEKELKKHLKAKEKWLKKKAEAEAKKAEDAKSESAEG